MFAFFGTSSVFSGIVSLAGACSFGCACPGGRAAVSNMILQGKGTAQAAGPCPVIVPHGASAAIICGFHEALLVCVVPP
jgi:hypothetical protein